MCSDVEKARINIENDSVEDSPIKNVNIHASRSRSKRFEHQINNCSTSHLHAKYPPGPRKSLRSRVLSARTKSTSNINNKVSFMKTHSRRYLYKKQGVKLTTPDPIIHKENCVYHEGTWFRVGDIVSVLDFGGEMYYAQLRGLVADYIGNSYCFLTWLVPSSDAVKDFKPSDYIIGMTEDVMRDISCCKLVCRCPADYYQPLQSPYAVRSLKEH